MSARSVWRVLCLQGVSFEIRSFTLAAYSGAHSALTIAASVRPPAHGSAWSAA